ncbi:PIN domain-containing protein [Beggiatoa alba B18LD]|uniref:PIN domain-containing protein n=1 Tax=Beggiatoa alba B18LD TaxID=395493 RepID=I3CHY4_9GAMM|nr:PIN domain-containing protein [Beggiatoa alba]EIJ43227.1 PIN domain-containing protein [Beggiatoa alba B18LD]
MSKGVLLDTNLLMVYLISELGQGEVEQFKRTREFTSDDADILKQLLKDFKHRYTIPQVLAEVSNLLDWMQNEDKQIRLKKLLAEYIDLSNELVIASKQLITLPIYFKLGITDAALFSLAKQYELTLITVDFGLYGYAQKYKIQTINFNHLRKL